MGTDSRSPVGPLCKPNGRFAPLLPSRVKFCASSTHKSTGLVPSALPYASRIVCHGTPPSSRARRINASVSVWEDPYPMVALGPLEGGRLALPTRRQARKEVKMGY